MAHTTQGRRRGGRGPMLQKMGGGDNGSDERAYCERGRVTPAQIRLNRNICAAADRGDASAVLSCAVAPSQHEPRQSQHDLALFGTSIG